MKRFHGTCCTVYCKLLTKNWLFCRNEQKIYGKLELKKFGFHTGLKLKRQLKSLQCIRAIKTNLFGFNSMAEKSIFMNLISWIYTSYHRHIRSDFQNLHTFLQSTNISPILYYFHLFCYWWKHRLSNRKRIIKCMSENIYVMSSVKLHYPLLN